MLESINQLEARIDESNDQELIKYICIKSHVINVIGICYINS